MKRTPEFKKTWYFTFFYAVVLCACVEPVDLATFLEDDDVELIIETGTTGTGTVALSSDSDAGLVAGNRKITGFTAGKYYKIEKRNEDASYDFLGYIKSDGARSGNLTDIGKIVQGAETTGLENNQTYRVKSAGYVATSQKITIISGASSVDYYPNGNGLLSLPPGASYFMGAPNFVTAGNTLEVLAVPASGNKEIIPGTGGRYALGAEGSTTDYIFVEKNGSDIVKFLVLKIEIDSNIVLEIAFDDDSYTQPTGADPQLGPHITVSLNDIYSAAGVSVTITVGNAAAFVGFSWLVNGTIFIHDSSQLSIDFHYNSKYNDVRDELFAPGEHTVTVRAQTQSGKFFSKDIKIEVTDD